MEIKIGLEIHVQASTNTKAFSPTYHCISEKPNKSISPICMGLPGTLPYLNSQLVEQAIKLCIATNSIISPKTFFDRKNYFYPDLPKGFQITQATAPIGSKGWFECRNAKGEYCNIPIERIQIEEDSGKSSHEENHSRIDFNRSGSPLLEIVTPPTFSKINDCIPFLKDFALTCKHLGISNCKMEEGNYRIDVNVSVSDKVKRITGFSELKNLNSYGSINKAVLFEIQNLTNLIQKGENSIRTCGYDTKLDSIIELRNKPSRDDYRYITEPDIPPVTITQEKIDEIKSQIPTLPIEKIKNYSKRYDLPIANIELIVSNRNYSLLFEQIESRGENPIQIAKIIIGPIHSFILDNPKSEINFINAVEELSKALRLLKEAKISKKDIYEVIIPHIGKKEKINFDSLVEENQKQLNQDNDILEIINNIVESNPEVVLRIKEGKHGLINYLTGLIIKKGANKIDPALIKKLLNNKLNQI